MFEAIHKQTYNETNSIIKSACRATEIWVKYKDPHKEEWLCCPVDKKPVTPVIKHTRIINEETIYIPSFFRHLSDVGGCTSKESDEHKNAKILLASLIESKEIILKIGKSSIPYSDLKFKKIPKLPFRWEQTREKRRADVLFELEEWHNVLGQGIVFEIQLSNMSEEEKKSRVYDWICNGYSLTWLGTKNFTENSLTNNEIVIDNVWSLSFVNIVKYMVKKINDLNTETTNLSYEFKQEIINLTDKFKQLMETYQDRSIKTCRSCTHSRIDRYNEELLACWFGINYGDKTRPSKHEQLGTCINWKSKG